MSSDGYFEDDLNAATFQELDAIEAAHFPPSKTSSGSRVQPKRPVPPKPLARDSSGLFDLSFDIDESELQRLDDLVNETYHENAPVAGPSNLPRTNLRGMHQTTLFGGVVPAKASSNESASAPRIERQRTKSASRNLFGRQAPKTKQWDRTAFAKSGVKSGKFKGNGKGKGKASFDQDEDEEEEVLEFEQFPAPFVSIDLVWMQSPPPPMKLKPDLLEAKHWIYPLNKPKRAYQYNIASRCLFDNTLVALPTGLGKTFIAGVVMLNFYRWFPEGKVVFVAPTKPLVAQQIEACHKVCGIPPSDTIELTGKNPKPMRGRAWRDKKVFFMTPQTLINDLTSENCDAGSIILVVIDEAHRGTGDYAYAQVVRFLMAKNPHFRVLALTATPGSTPEAVQNIIDALHISRIEIRDENSLDLKEYVHKKVIKKHIIRMNEDIGKIRDSLAKLMNAVIQPLRTRGVLYERQGNPVTMTSYFPQHISRSLKKDQTWAYVPLARLSALARAMGYLIEGTIGMCYTYLQEISSHDHDHEQNGKKAAKANKLRSNPLFQAVMKEIETQRNRGFVMHPKMDMLKLLILQHFDHANQEDCGKGTRVMVFVEYRECVDEIVEALNLERPLIQASRFIGQGTDKQGNRGFGQREQLEVIKKFKAGEYNVLVSTSIGEEGLDIGEIDLIVCYDSQKTPIRMLQRVGRTGREREGLVHVLLAEGREEFNLEKSEEAYREVQKAIIYGEHLELYADVERLLPDHVKPECLEKVMEIEEYVREEPTRKRSIVNKNGSPERGTKRKRNDDMGRNIPAGASTGFVSVAELVVKGAKKKKMTAKAFDVAGQDDDTDLDIEAGSILNPPHRTVSASATTSSTPQKKPRKAASKAVKKAPTAKKRPSKKSAQPELTYSQLLQKGVDDSDDMEIGNCIAPSHPEAILECLTPSTPERLELPEHCLASPHGHKTIVLISSDDERLSPSPSAHSSPRRTANANPRTRASNQVDGPQLLESETELPVNSPAASPDHEPEDNQSMAWLVDEDDDLDLEIVDSSPMLNSRRAPRRPAPDDESVEFVKSNSVSPLKFNRHTNNYGDVLESKKDEESVEFILDNSVLASPPNRVSSPKSSPAWHLSSSPSPRAKKDLRKFDMLPPDLPAHEVSSDRDFSVLSFPVRPAGKPRKYPAAVMERSSLSPDMPPPSQRRLRRARAESSPVRSPEPPKRKKAKEPAIAKKPNLLIDIEAIHSGDDSPGSSHGDDEEEDDDDRLFVQNQPETQASPSYDQSLAYRQSLISQAPSGWQGPVFANRPIRRGPFAGGSISGVGRRRFMPSPPRGDDDEPDEYVVGSFVVDDDAEISFVGNSSSEL